MKRKNYWLIMLIAIFVLGIGYAAISNITLLINGSATAAQGLTDDEFVVRYIKASDTESSYSGVASVASNPASYVITKGTGNKATTTASAAVTNDTEATFTAADMEKGDHVTYTYYVANLSEEDVPAHVYVDVQNSSNSSLDYFTITATLEKTTLNVGDVSKVTVVVQCSDQKQLEEVSGTFVVKLVAGINEDTNGQSSMSMGNSVLVTASTPAEITAILSDATIANANIVLTDDIALTSLINASNGGTVNIDLNGNNINRSGAYAFNVTNGTDLVLKGEGNITTSGDGINVENGTLTVDGPSLSTTRNGINVAGTNSEVIINSGTITTPEAAIFAKNSGKVVINGGTITGNDNCAVMGNGTAGQGNTEIVMNGGTLVGHIQSAGYIACGVYLPNEGTFTMNGGEIQSDGAGIVMRGGVVNLNGGTITATGATGVKGKVGDSNITVVPYAVVYEAKSQYPAYQTLELNVSNSAVLNGTDGAIATILGENMTANITNNSSYSVTNITE